MIEQSEKIIDVVLHNEHLSMNDKEYVELRDSLKRFRRFYELGTIDLIDKSRGIFCDLREISSSLKVHYKWLTKLFKKLFAFLNKNSCNGKIQLKLANFSEKYLNLMVNPDKFRKLRKNVKKLLSIPLPHFSEDTMIFHEKLRSTLRKCSITDEDLIGLSKTRLKIASLGIAENLTIREKLIDISVQNLKDSHVNRVDSSVKLDEMSTKIVVLKELEDNRVKFNDNLTDIEIWPIYEFFFLLFIYRFQRKVCEKFSDDFVQEIHEKFNENFSNQRGENIPQDSLMIIHESSENLCETISEKFGKIYEEIVFQKFEKVPTIPADLIGLMKTLNSLPERGTSLFPKLLFSVEEFSEQSFAVKNSDVLLHWYDNKEIETEDSSSNSEVCIHVLR